MYHSIGVVPQLQLTVANDVASKSFVSFKHSSISKLKTAIFLPCYCHLIVYAITLLLRMRVGAVCETTRQKDYANKGIKRPAVLFSGVRTSTCRKTGVHKRN